MAIAQAQLFQDLNSAGALQRYRILKAEARAYAEGVSRDASRLSRARSFCTATLAAYWHERCLSHRIRWKIRPHGLSLPSLTTGAQSVADELGRLVASFPVEDAGYLIGSIYTVMLPEAMRSGLGAYYTPPPMVKRLLDLVESAGTDFAKCSTIDPACGGGAFLAPVALRMFERTKRSSAKSTLHDIVARLRGIELDSFAAWMTQVLLEVSLLPLCVSAKERFPQVVIIGDALKHDSIGTHELVIGNPPYGRVRLDEELRSHYARSLYGHANLYGLFTDLALRLVKPGGVIAYLTPTSFLGGKYFKALRDILSKETTPYAFDFIADRDGVFDNVLQETMLATYCMGKTKRSATVSLIIPQGLETARIEPLGKAQVPSKGIPWTLPRTAQGAIHFRALDKMPTRLSDYGYRVSTGQLVWNRHKLQLCHQNANGELPIIWAESVTSAGFRFSAARRNHAPYIKLHNQPHLVTSKSCVLLQRTTAKEQQRRLLSAVIPQAFINQSNGVVVENHLNLIYAENHGKVSPDTLSAILNSEAVDRAFRCISGSVAVSAYELEALPLPTIKQAKSIEALLRKKAGRKAIEAQIASYYQGSKR